VLSKERLKTNGRVAAAGIIAKERITTDGRVVAAGCVGKTGVKTDRRVAAAGCEVEERAVTLSGVEIRVTAIRWRAHRSRCCSSENECTDETNTS